MIVEGHQSRFQRFLGAEPVPLRIDIQRLNLVLRDDRDRILRKKRLLGPQLVRRNDIEQAIDLDGRRQILGPGCDAVLGIGRQRAVL